MILKICARFWNAISSDGITTCKQYLSSRLYEEEELEEKKKNQNLPAPRYFSIHIPQISLIPSLRLF